MDILSAKSLEDMTAELRAEARAARRLAASFSETQTVRDLLSYAASLESQASLVLETQ